jgi:di/tricarboxylate transporter
LRPDHGAASMSTDQLLAFAILGLTLVLFAWGRWRYDLVAVLALLAVVLGGLIPVRDAFLGFAQPAVITVAAVLIISRALQNAGIVEFVVKGIAPLRAREHLQLAAQTVIIALLSSFMNNVGALALMLPVALRNAYRDDYTPAKSLMPLAFGSLLGGLTTLIGTPPNIIVSAYRAQAGGQPFAMFDFTPVGIVVAAAGLAFVVLVGWRLIPKERLATEGEKKFAIADYVTEARVEQEAKAAGATIFELEAMAEEDVTILGVVRDDLRRLAPAGSQRVWPGDILLLRGDTEALKALIDAAGLKLAQDRVDPKQLQSEEIDVVEAVVGPSSRLIGRTPVTARLRTLHGLNLLALARQGVHIRERLGHASFRSGDVLLLQGPGKGMMDVLAELGCIPLAGRDIGIARRQRLLLAAAIFGLAIAVTIAGLLPVHVSFLAAAAGMVLVNIIKLDEVYAAIDWPVIVLLAAMFPVGGALEATGAAALVADGVLRVSQGLGPAWVLLIVFVTTMFVSDVINNNATALLMAPLAVTVAARLGVSPDPFLMAVAIGASCAFLTPIGHQSNTLVMEPGGYRFGDYWRVGLPLEAVIVAVAMPMILLVWPF